MGQVVFNGQRPKYCNLQAIQTEGHHVDDAVALKEIWLVDTTNSSKSNSGTGKYDAYIVGDGVKTAGQLASTDLRYIDTPIDLSEYSNTYEMNNAISRAINNLSIPRNLAQLASDSMHRTVSDADINKWNNSTGDGDITNNADNEDLASVEVQEGVSVLKFKDKAFDESAFSGYGRMYLRKKIVNEGEKERVDLVVSGVPDTEVEGAIIYDDETGEPVIDEETGEYKREPSTFTPANIAKAVTLIDDTEQETGEHIAVRITHAYWDLRNSVNGKAVLHDRNTTSDTSLSGYWSVGYIVTPVTAGETCNVTANFKSNTANATAGYFWAIIDDVVDSTKRNILQCDETSSDDNHAVSSLIEVEHTGWLVVNHITYQNPPYSLVLQELTGVDKDFNIVSFPNAQNTIFTIQYDYDLNGRILELPPNSVLKFEGGSIRNATIRGNKTLIVAKETEEIFGRKTELVGTWKNSDWYPKWFGAYQDGETDDTEILQRMMNLSAIIGRRVHLRLGNYSYRTTRGLLLKNNVYLYGGTINAKFDNPLDWVIQTEALYNYKLTGYRSFGGWQAYDQGIMSHCGPCYIEGTTINGSLNKHMVNGEWDGTYCPIFGGVRMQAGILPTKGLRINNVGYGFARACSLNSYDKDMIIHAYFRAYTARDVNNVTVYDTYFTAHSHYQKSSVSDTSNVIPYYPEYHGLTPAGSWVAGNGGYDDTGAARPKYVLINASYAWIDFVNFTTDTWSEVAVAVGEDSQVCVQNAWFEAVNKAYIYVGGNYTKTTFINTHAHSAPEYDIYCASKSDTAINLIKSGITCSGYGDNNATTHKFYFVRYFEPTINVLEARTNDYPNLSLFHYLSGSNVWVNIVGTEYAGRYQPSVGEHLNGSNGSYCSLYYALRNFHNYYYVPANTTVAYTGGSIIVTATKVFKGASRTTSILALNASVTYSYCNITFENLTISIEQFRTNDSKFNFKDCNIIGLRDNNRTNSIRTEYYFKNCTFINIPDYQNGSTRYFAFGRGSVTINNCTFNPFVRYNNAPKGDNYLTDVTYDYSMGTTATRNLISWHAAKGEEFFNVDTNRKEYWNGRTWGDANGFPYTPLRGNGASRPALPNMKIGTRYTDTDIDATYELTANGSSGYGVFAFDVKIPKVTRNIYIGRTLVEPTDGEFMVNLPVGTYPVYCNGYACSPSVVTISSGTSSLSVRTKASIYSTTFTVSVYVKDTDGNALDNQTVMVGGYTATRVVKKNVFQGYYNASVPCGTYPVYIADYEEYGSVVVNGRNTSVTITAETAYEEPVDTIEVSGAVYSMDSLENTNGDVITAGKFNVSVDSTSLEVSLTATDLSLILYSINYTEAELNRQFAYLLMRKWFEAGHYADYASGARLYSDTVGTGTGVSASFTDNETTPTNLICTATHTTGTNAVWEQAAGGGSSANMEVISASGTTLSVSTGKYYRFDTAVNALTITLPAQTASNVAKAVIIYLTAGNDPDITITAADNKGVVYFDNYDISAGNTYELNCMFNGLKWVVGTSLINDIE